MALVYNEDEEKRASLHYEEEPPPPAFQMDSHPSSMVHIPQPNSMVSVEAEVLLDNKNGAIPNKPFNVYNRNQNNQMMNMNGMMMNNMMMPPNMNNMAPNMNNMAPNMNNMGQMPIFSEEFMKGMLDMAAMDVKSMNKNMQKKLQNIQRSSNPSNINQYNRNPRNKPPQKQPNKPHPQFLNKIESSPNVFKQGYNGSANLIRPKSQPPSQPPPVPYGVNNHINGYKAPKHNAPPPPPQKQQKVQKIQQIQQQKQPQKAQQQEFDNPIQSELVSMGFDKEYVIRACNLYKKKFKNKPLRLEVLTEIIIRLQQRDQSRRQRSKSIDSIAGGSAAVAAPDPKRKEDINPDPNRNARRRSSVQGNLNQNMYNNNKQLQQSESYEYIQNNNDYHNKYGRMNDKGMNNMDKQKSINSAPESIAVSVVMSSSSIGPQTCDIIIRKDQTLQDAKQLISTCLADFDQYDQSYAFFHDESGLIFDDFDIPIIQMLQLMDINVEKQNIVLTLKIGRIITKYIKLK